MKNGFARFEFFLQTLEELLKQAGSQTNPALWLYTNDARTPLFMLEGLSRLYAGMHNKKKFKNLQAHFKSLEDGLGKIDFYDNYAKEFAERPTIPVSIKEYMVAQAREQLQHMNDLLQQEKWLGENADRLQKIRKKLKDAKWLRPKEEVKAISNFYEEAIDSIVEDYNNAPQPFTEMEDQVHELRRELRWLSIYPQALRGLIQLTETGMPGASLQKYLVREIVESKYNVMPDPGDNKWFVLMEKNHFYALSWMIAETGKIKDQGLQVYAIAEALQQTAALSQNEAFQQALQTLAWQNNSVDELLQNASDITKAFMDEHNLQQLYAGIARIQQSAIDQ